MILALSERSSAGIASSSPNSEYTSMPRTGPCGDLRDDHLLVHADVLARRAPDVRQEGDELRREEGGDDGDEGRRQPKEGADDRDGAQLHDGDGTSARATSAARAPSCRS